MLNYTLFSADIMLSCWMLINVKENLDFYVLTLILLLSPLGQSVASPIADPGVVSSISAWPHTLVEIDHQIISTIFLLIWLIQEVLLSVTRECVCG